MNAASFRQFELHTFHRKSKFKFYADFGYEMRILSKVICFLVKNNWNDCRQILPNMNCILVIRNWCVPKVWYPTKPDIFELILSHNDWNIEKRSCRADLRIVLDPSPGWLSNGALIQEVLDIEVTTSLEVNHFGNTWAIRSKCSNFC